MFGYLKKYYPNQIGCLVIFCAMNGSMTFTAMQKVAIPGDDVPKPLGTL